jgi:hypothetical protein
MMFAVVRFWCIIISNSDKRTELFTVLLVWGRPEAIKHAGIKEMRKRGSHTAGMRQASIVDS